MMLLLCRCSRTRNDTKSAPVSFWKGGLLSYEEGCDLKATWSVHGKPFQNYLVRVNTEETAWASFIPATLLCYIHVRCSVPLIQALKNDFYSSMAVISVLR